MVISDGAEATREQKLLAWAGDFAAQRAQLVRTQAELAQVKLELRGLRAEVGVRSAEAAAFEARNKVGLGCCRVYVAKRGSNSRAYVGCWLVDFCCKLGCWWVALNGCQKRQDAQGDFLIHPPRRTDRSCNVRSQICAPSWSPAAPAPAPPWRKLPACSTSSTMSPGHRVTTGHPVTPGRASSRRPRGRKLPQRRSRSRGVASLIGSTPWAALRSKRLPQLRLPPPLLPHLLTQPRGMTVLSAAAAVLSRVWMVAPSPSLWVLLWPLPLFIRHASESSSPMHAIEWQLSKWDQGRTIICINTIM